MSKNKLCIISLIILFFAIALPLGLSFCGETALSVIDSISASIAAACGVITVLIAILLYSKYGIEQSIKEKNYNVVLKIAEELKNTIVFARSESKNEMYYVRLNNFDDNLCDDHGFARMHLEDTIYFNFNYAYGLDRLSELGRDLFVPKEIAAAIQSLQFMTFEEVKVENRADHYAVVSVLTEGAPKYDELVGKFNGQDMVMKDYIQLYQKVKTSLKDWLIKNGAKEGSLNF